MTLLCLRDYYVKRSESKAAGPLTDEEREEIEDTRDELPQKEARSIWWYFLNPREGIRHGAIGLMVLPFAIIFLPMILLVFLLPDPNRK